MFEIEYKYEVSNDVPRWIPFGRYSTNSKATAFDTLDSLKRTGKYVELRVVEVTRTVVDR